MFSVLTMDIRWACPIHWRRVSFRMFGELKRRCISSLMRILQIGPSYVSGTKSPQITMQFMANWGPTQRNGFPFPILVLCWIWVCKERIPIPVEELITIFKFYIFQVCHSCENVVSVGQERMEIGPLVYHKSDHCFTCKSCSRGLENHRVFVKGINIYCHDCFKH